ncbi:MAG: cell division protein ZapA [Gammaproteobacteria bacterium]|nr:cell division protein ZapA [Gammaproteobacteria bacterium]
MSEPIPVTINILDKEYVVSCPAGEEESLKESAQVLGKRMSAARENGKTLGTERIAVVTALNVVHEHLTLSREHEQETQALNDGLTRLKARIDSSLNRQIE